MSNDQFQSDLWEENFVKVRRGLKKRQRRIEFFNIKKSDSVLDLGCGDGLDAEIIKKMHVRKIIGLDPSYHLIKLARKRNPTIDFKVGKAEKLPFPNKSFSVIFINSTLHHITEFDKVIFEIKRVLKNNGFLCFIEPHSSYIRTVVDKITELKISKFIPFLRKRRIFYLEDKNVIKNWLKKEQYFIELLENNKFKKEFIIIDFLTIIAKFRNC